MALNKDRLKNKIVAVMNDCQKETDNPNASKNLFAEKLAEAIIEEIKELTIVYTSGLVAPPNGGPVTGSLDSAIIK